jgi:hypothetical protein
MNFEILCYIRRLLFEEVLHFSKMICSPNCRCQGTERNRWHLWSIQDLPYDFFLVTTSQWSPVSNIHRERDMIYLTAVGLTPGGSSTVRIYTQTIHRTTQFTNYEECGPCPVFASYTLAFALQLRKKHGKTSVRVAGECQLAKNIQNRVYMSIRIHKHNKNT